MDTNTTDSTSPMTRGGGLAAGVAIGVALSLVLDSWAYLAIGIAVGLVLSGTPLIGRRKPEARRTDMDGTHVDGTDAGR